VRIGCGTFGQKIRIGVGLSLLLAACSAAAGDLMDSPACVAAMKALQQEEGRMQADTSDKTRWLQLRQLAAKACLGPAADSRAPRRATATAPISVLPSTAGRVPSRPGASPATEVPAVRQDTVRAITSCDAAGCWTSDGSRVQRMGPDLVGPRGICTVQGAVISCP
jgi:hypothetical protein